MSDFSNVLSQAVRDPHPGSSMPLPICPAQIDTENAGAWQSMVHARFGTISSLYVSLRAKHPPAAAHSLRVAFWTSAWAIKYGLKEDQLQLFETLALLHEIGKIGIPDRVLQKQEKLVSHEQSMMDMHTQVGLEILRAAGASKELLLAIAGIGTSYESSSNLQSTDIAPLASRLVNIIDAFDSMTAKQAYREAKSREMALAEIIRYGGTQFDPKLSKSFAELVLSNDRPLQARVAERWINQIEKHDFSRLFEMDHRPARDRMGSTLVQSLNETFYRHMMDHVQNGVVFIDSEFRILDWNSAAERFTGRSVESVLHQYWSPQIAGLCDVDGFQLAESECPFHELITSGVTRKRRLSIRTQECKILQVQVDVVPVTSDRGHLCGGAMIIEDVSETAELERKIIHLRERACQDQLTKLSNRGELNRQLPEFVEYHQRSGEPASVVICDIDFFKKINDTFSHQAGDEALIAFAKLLRESCRETDFVARYGGEEFVMLCGHCDLNEAKELAETIRKKLQRTPIAALRNQCLTASFGVAVVQPEDSTESVLGRADRGLLIAKESGRDQVVALGDSEPSAAPSNLSTMRTWWEWLGASRVKSIRSELFTNVPRAITLEKLKGFVREFGAIVKHVDGNDVILDLDCKYAPIAKLKNERLGKFRMLIKVTDIEMKVPKKNGNVQLCTLLDIEITSLRSRDRRVEAIRSQASRLKTALQGYLLAHELNDVQRADIVRTLKPENNSRYE